MRRYGSTGIAVALAAAAAAWMSCAHGSPSSVAPEEEGCETSQDWGASAVTVLCGEDLQTIPAFQIEEILQGRVPGLSVVQEANGLSLLIRGRSTILGNNEPLYVLDGVPLQMEPGRGLYWLSPRDIERIEILKDASATSFWGVRGANGVVLITTRRR